MSTVTKTATSTPAAMVQGHTPRGGMGSVGVTEVVQATVMDEIIASFDASLVRIEELNRCAKARLFGNAEPASEKAPPPAGMVPGLRNLAERLDAAIGELEGHLSVI